MRGRRGRAPISLGVDAHWQILLLDVAQRLEHILLAYTWVLAGLFQQVHSFGVDSSGSCTCNAMALSETLATKRVGAKCNKLQGR
jgi:hypothetical protein